MEQDQETQRMLAHWNPSPGRLQKLLCAGVVGLSRFIMQGMNSVNFDGTERWDACFRQTKRGVLSFSNHVSLFDDPLLVSNLGRVRFDDVRWIGADHKNFYGTAVKGFISSAGKCVPLVRGGGLDQLGLTFLVERLKAGDWVHIFPEGGRTRDEKARMRSPFKLGIGQLIAEAKPLAMPFYHYGMHTVLPIGRRLPSARKQVRVLFGDSVVIDESWLQSLQSKRQGVPLYRAIADWSESVLRQLQARLHPTPD